MAREFDSCGIASHSPILDSIYDELLTLNQEVIPTPLARSSKWASSLRPADLTCSAKYFTDGACGAVHFFDAVQKIQKNAIIIEIGPQAQMDRAFAKEVPDVIASIGLIRRKEPELMSFLRVRVGKKFFK